jgi:hypothetical protein
MFLAHKVNDDVLYSVPENQLPPNGSRAVAMAVALIGRENEQTTWVAKNTWLFPS